MTTERLSWQRQFDRLDNFATREVDTEIKDIAGKVIFAQHVTVPADWSDQAATVVASKYFYGDKDKGNDPARGGRESSVTQLVGRVCWTIAKWGWMDKYFKTEDDVLNFSKDLGTLCFRQCGAFNSPVWFNVGLYDTYGIRKPSENWIWDNGWDTTYAQQAVPCPDAYEYPQASACFIQSVTDDMAGIMALATSEATLFKYGSGTGTDLSTLRSSREKLSGGGKPSGPVSFMRIYDAIAGVIKSGGKTRRAAKIQTLRCDHPDILEFIDCKAQEDAKALALIKAGYSDNMTGDPQEAYSSVFFQNSNLSVRVTDKFMSAAETRGTYATKAVTTGESVSVLSADDVLGRIAEQAWLCGDPGLQYDDTMNRWHTTPNSGRLNCTNPCSEFCYMDDTACNLASLNLLKFLHDGTFDVDSFRAAVRTFIVAQEIIVDRASYPTKKIAENSHNFRPLGLGYANLGAFLMAKGLPYDSDEGRSYAAAITALLHAEAYKTSAELAKVKGSFPGFSANREPMLNVVQMHKKAILDAQAVAHDYDYQDCYSILELAWHTMDEAKTIGAVHGFRNAQVTLLAPTGTIAFMMDCSTLGIEPELALVKYKKLAGGGQMKIVNSTIDRALRHLNYTALDREHVLEHVKKYGTVENVVVNGKIEFSCLADNDLPVFDCAFPTGPSGRSISWQGHLKMMAAVQPFLSGSISKTCNMPASATPEDIKAVYREAWRLGIKALAVYRDGSKGVQPLNTQTSETNEQTAEDHAEDEAFAAIFANQPIPHQKLVDALIQTDQEIRRGKLGFVDWSSVQFQDANGTAKPTEEELVRAIGEARKGSPLVLPGEPPILPRYHRERLPATREGLTHKFQIGGHEGYLTVGLYPDGRPGEIFVKMSKQGSTVDGLMDSVALSVSIGLQSGVPLDVFIQKFSHTRFDPSGPTGNPAIPFATSPVDYIFRWLQGRFLESSTMPQDATATPEAPEVHPSVAEGVTDMPEAPEDDPVFPKVSLKDVLTHHPIIAKLMQEHFTGTATISSQGVVTYRKSPGDQPVVYGLPCPECGAIMSKQGSCWGCPNCYSIGPCG